MDPSYVIYVFLHLWTNETNNKQDKKRDAL